MKRLVGFGTPGPNSGVLPLTSSSRLESQLGGRLTALERYWVFASWAKSFASGAGVASHLC
jgi:hypothetical protein